MTAANVKGDNMRQSLEMLQQQIIGLPAIAARPDMTPIVENLRTQMEGLRTQMETMRGAIASFESRNATTHSVEEIRGQIRTLEMRLEQHQSARSTSSPNTAKDEVTRRLEADVQAIKLAQVDLKRQMDAIGQTPSNAPSQEMKERFMEELAKQVEKEMETFVETRVQEWTKMATVRVSKQGTTQSTTPAATTPSRQPPPSPGVTDSGPHSPPPGGWVHQRPAEPTAPMRQTGPRRTPPSPPPVNEMRPTRAWSPSTEMGTGVQQTARAETFPPAEHGAWEPQTMQSLGTSQQRPEVNQGPPQGPAGYARTPGLSLPRQGGLTRPERVPVGTYGRFQGAYDGGESVMGYSTSHYSGEGPGLTSARVNAIGGGDSVVMATSHPLQAESLRHHKIKKFSGRCEDWDDFERDWNLYLQLVQTGPHALPNAAVLSTLKRFLDRGSQAQLDSELRQDPNLPYYVFWGRLKARFAKDVLNVHRQNWMRVSLPRPGEWPTLMEWREFEVNHRGKRAIVDDWTDAEDHNQIMRQLPQDLRRRVIHEQQKRRKGQRRIRISAQVEGVADMARQDIEQQLGIQLKIILADNRQCTVACTDEMAETIVEYDGSRYNGPGIVEVPVKIQQVEYTMKGDDIMTFVTQLLETEDEDRRYEETLGLNTPKGNDQRRESRDHHNGRPYENNSHRDRRDRDRRVYATGQEGPRGNGGKGRSNNPRTDSPRSGASYEGQRPQGWGKGQKGAKGSSNRADHQNSQYNQHNGKGNGKGTGKGWKPPQQQTQNLSGKGYSNQRPQWPALPEPKGVAEPQTQSDDKNWCFYCLSHNKPWHHEYKPCQYRQKYWWGPYGNHRDASKADEGAQSSNTAAPGSSPRAVQ